MRKRWVSLLALLPALSLLNGCIRPQPYRLNQPAIHYSYSAADPRYGVGYFRSGGAYETYIEFNARGALYRDLNGSPVELNRALDLIRRCRFRPDTSARCPNPNAPLSGHAKPIALYVFVHGWKNNASDDSGNTWGFRRFLSYAAYRHPDRPVVGVYVGWPGAVLKGDLFLSFWNREPVADIVGNSNEFRLTLKQLLHEAKGAIDPNRPLGVDFPVGPSSYSSSELDPSTAVVIGHSFGGIVLEHAATALLQEVFDAQSSQPDLSHPLLIHPPADLFVLINEAGAASIARPFLTRLKESGLTYYCRPATSRGVPEQEKSPEQCPLILSMTSEGDLATKFAYPGGEILSWNRTRGDKHLLDMWGQDNDTPYNLITAANFVALQSHHIDRLPVGQRRPYPCLRGSVTLPRNQFYCLHSLRVPDNPNSLIEHPNDTPYWLLQLPQVFVPDHGTVFQDAFLNLLETFIVPQRRTLAVAPAQLRMLQSR